MPVRSAAAMAKLAASIASPQPGPASPTRIPPSAAPVCDHAAEQQEADHGNQLGRRDVSDVAGRAADPEHGKGDRHEIDRGPRDRDDVARHQQPEIAALQWPRAQDHMGIMDPARQTGQQLFARGVVRGP
jgi:hypothetical protein